MRMRDLLVRGMLAGCLAGVVAFAVATAFAEPHIEAAIALEGGAHAHDGVPHTHADGEEGGLAVSRGVQRTAGLLVGLTVLGVAFGGLLAVVFALVHRRIGGPGSGDLGVRGTALSVALLGFLAIYLVPFLKYPPNPPAVGDGETIGMRTGAYLGLLVISLVLAGGALWARQALARGLGAWTASIAAGALFALGVAVVFLLLPGVDEVPAGFPAELLWRFRVGSLATQLALWAAMGLAFGALLERRR